MDFKKLLGFGKNEANEHGTLESKLEEILTGLPDDKIKYITGLAGLLGKVAYADRNITSEEIDKMRNILSESSSLETAHLEQVISLVSELTKELAGIEDYRYTRLILEHTNNKEEHMKVLETLFRVASSDNEICNNEDHTIGNIAAALRLSRKDFINSRLKFKEYLSVLKGLPDS